MFGRGQASFDYFLLQVFLFSLIVGALAFVISSQSSNDDSLDSSVLEDFVDEIESFSFNAFSRSVGSRVSFDYYLDASVSSVVHPVNSSGDVVDDRLFFVSNSNYFPAYFEFPVFFYFSEESFESKNKKVFFENFLDGSSSEKFLVVSFDSVCPAADLPSSVVLDDFFCDCFGSSRPSYRFDKNSNDEGVWFTEDGERSVSGLDGVTSFGNSSCFLKDFNGDCHVNSLDVSFLSDSGLTSDSVNTSEGECS